MESTKLLKSNVTQIQFNSVQLNSEQWEQIPKIAINFIRYFQHYRMPALP
ncbi:hypothetical protein VCR17J2_610064 [Vibrio coralliirubri]|nr:hypothetical protein VCR17J2_610064 [Vibrio coralliirubri]